MEIKYFTKNISLSEENKAFLEKKIKKFLRFSKKIEEVDIDLSYHQKRAKENAVRLEINLKMPNKILRAVVRAEDLQTAIDRVENKLRKQLEKYKGFGLFKRRQTASLLRKAKSIL